MAVRKRQPGRPAKPAKEGTKATLSLRVTPDLKRRLEAAGESSGRNLSQEAELRLDRSFQAEGVLSEALELMFPGGASVLMDALLQLIKLVGPHTGYFSTLNAAGARNWFDNPYAYDQVASGIGSLVEKLRPPGPTAFPQELEKDADVQKYFGRDVARELLEVLVHEGGGGANDEEITRSAKKLSTQRRRLIASRLAKGE
jgi:hypothetical protein